MVIGGKDVDDVLSDCSLIFDAAYSSICPDCDDGSSCDVHTNRFRDSRYILNTADYKPDPEEEATLNDHLLLLRSLCDRRSKSITLKPSSPPERKSDFAVFAKLADTARDILTKHWPVVVALADWLDREKEIPNQDVHDFLMQRLSGLLPLVADRTAANGNQT